jgi:formamidopyrimidine-DNA glycosylase
MPELPEVQTTVIGIKIKVLNRTFIDVWTDTKNLIKKPKDFLEFKKQIKNKKVKNVYRRAKNIIVDLSENCSLLIHQKMTGHLLFGKWKIVNKKWKPVDEKSLLNDPYNRFIHFILFLDNGKMLALSDSRKFAKIELWKTEELLNSKEFKLLGPEPLEKSFNYTKFKKLFLNKKGRVKQVIMDPYFIAGIGNIYASEALWHSKIHPEKNVSNLKEAELKLLYLAIKKVLTLGVKLGGESFSDYRKPDGSKGDFDTERKAYKREGQKCFRCKEKIKRIKIAQRSAFYCPNCQKL